MCAVQYQKHEQKKVKNGISKLFSLSASDVFKVNRAFGEGRKIVTRWSLCSTGESCLESRPSISLHQEKTNKKSKSQPTFHTNQGRKMQVFPFRLKMASFFWRRSETCFFSFEDHAGRHTRDFKCSPPHPRRAR